MGDQNLERLAEAMSTLAARMDALTWVVGALAESHPHPEAVLQAWTRRQHEAADGGFETDFQHYRERYLKELQDWSGTLAAIAQRHRLTHPSD